VLKCTHAASFLLHTLRTYVLTDLSTYIPS
jgi:hypothetical protein